MKFCFSTLGCTEYAQIEALELARRFDIKLLELRGLCGELNVRKMQELLPENRAATKENFREYGVDPLILGTSCSFHDEAKFESFIDEGIYAIDAARDIGFRGIRVFGNNVKGDENECLDRIARGITALCEYALNKGVEVLLETHGDVNTAERLGRVAEICGKYENFGFIWDVCHTRLTYGENWRTFCDDFRKLIRHVHLKDVTPDGLTLPGEGTLPLREMAEYLTANGYDGAFSLEWERKWHPELPPIEDALTALFNILK